MRKNTSASSDEEELSSNEKDITTNNQEEKETDILENSAAKEGKKMVPSMCGTIFWWCWFVCTVVLLTYFGTAFVVLYSKAAKMEMIFSHRFTMPWFSSLSDCHSFGLPNCENLQITTNDGRKLGAWLISPYSRQIITHDAYILYLHGNGGSRGDSHCVELYQKLSRMGYHVIAIDYRGFADSDGFPTENGLLEDAKAAYQWMAERYEAFPLYLWGHSLGSAVAVQLAAWLNSEHSPEHLRLNGVVLEAPFNNMVDGIKHAPLAAPIVPFIPDFESYVTDVENVFQSSYWIQKVSSPIVILHDTNDWVINVSLGRKLYQTARDVGLTHVSMVEIKENLGHFQICQSKKFRNILQNFIQQSV